MTYDETGNQTAPDSIHSLCCIRSGFHESWRSMANGEGQCAQLSHVKQYGDETTEPYALLAILGLTPNVELVLC